MSKSTYDVAEELGIAPADVILRMKLMGAEWFDCWPFVEDSWVETLAEMDGDHGARTEEAVLPVEVEEETAELPCSREAARVIEKLYRNTLWGEHSASSASAARMANLSIAEYTAARDELVRMDLVILFKRKRNAVSLNPSKQPEVKEILRAFGLEIAE